LRPKLPKATNDITAQSRGDFLLAPGGSNKRREFSILILRATRRFTGASPARLAIPVL
jgi:hypothetical protein